MSTRRFVWIGVAVCALLNSGSVQAQDCNDLFNPDQVLTFNITMDPAEWEALRFTCSNGVCDPPPHTYSQAVLQCGSIGPILVGIRQKSDLPEPSGADPQKVSLKLDINEFAPGQTFAGKKKISLENGGEGATVSEGLSYQMYQAAGGFVAGRSAWVNVYVNGDYKGLYSNVEQVDKVFLTDHGLDDGGWLIKEEDQRTRENPLELNAFAFNWYPFDHADPQVYPPESTPPDWLDQALWRVNMPALLHLAAAENFVANTDAAVQKMTNYWYYDWSILPGDDPAGQQPRLYFPWDMDTVFKSQDTELDILDSGTGHLQQGLIKEIDSNGVPYPGPTFQADYFTIYRDLLNGPLALAETLALVDGLEPLLTPHINADPYQQTGSAAEEFQRLRDFVQGRTNSLISQLVALGEGYPLQTVVNGNGTITRDPDNPTVYDPADVVELTAAADPGWHFVGWANGAWGTDNPLLVTMDQPKLVTAFFAPIGQTVAIYDFNANAGVDRFAFGTYTDSWAEDLNGQRRKCPEVCTEITTITADAYSRLGLSDAFGGDSDPNRYVNPDPAGQQDESTLVVEYNIAEDPSDVTRIDVLWEGYGDKTHHLELYIWDYVQGNWGNGAGLYGENNFMDHGSGDADFVLSGSVSTNVGNYISPTGEITLLVYDDQRSEDTFHDYTRLVATASAGECLVDGDCDDGIGCTDDICVDGDCVFTPNDANCPDDGLFCNGAESCDAVNDCVSSGDPCAPELVCNETTDTCDWCQVDGDCSDGVVCTDDTCVDGSCVFTPNHGNCDDGAYCNGAETCDALLDCQAGMPVNCDDGVSCTDDSCNEATGSCDNVPNDANCDNGEFCDGAETCDALADCQAGADPCPGQDCDEVNDECVPPVCNENGVCDTGEDQCNCPQDCGTPPSTEISCTDGADNDCDGWTDCEDGDCDSDPACACLPKRAPCTADDQCCSNWCHRGACK